MVNSLWLKDNFLNKFGMLNDIGLVSFDIFDTLIFRKTARATDIFEKLGERLIKEKIIDECITPDIFKELRIKVEVKARALKKKEYNTTEVNLLDIYACMPPHFQNIKKMIELEIKEEIKNVFLNSSIYSFIQYLHKNGKKIVLASDMYLLENHIKMILEHVGFNLNLVDKIYISNECNASKASGSMYKLILSDYNVIKPEQIVHIGDNFNSDISKAKEFGIHAIHYPVIPPKMDYDIFEREELLCGKYLIPAFTAIRKLAAAMLPQCSENEKFWFQTGAIILGPILALASEWGLITAQKNNIKNIYPLMREGKILGDFLKKSIQKKGLAINVKPIFVSRASLFLPSMINVDEGLLDVISNTKGLTVKNIFEILKITYDDQDFSAILDIPVKQLEKENIYAKNKLMQFLFSETIKNQILENACLARESLSDYFKEFDFENPYLTFDIGYGATIAEFLDKIVNTLYQNNKGIHLITFSKPNIIPKIIDGVNILTLCGLHPLKEFFNISLIFEQLVMCREGSTIGYEDGMPILSENIISDSQLSAIEICQQGALLFYDLMLESNILGRTIEMQFNNIMAVSKDLPLILERLYKLPLFEEANLMGKLKYDNNFGTNEFVPVITREHVEEVKEQGIENFLSDISYHDKIYWKNGIITLIDKDFILKQNLLENMGIGYEKAIIRICETMQSDGIEKAVLYGAGEAGRKFLSIMGLYHIKAVCFVDRNKMLHGLSIDGAEVISLESAVEKYGDVPFVIASFAYIHEIADGIKKAFEHKGKPTLYYDRQ